ncbi:TlpA family protein disulfide reductase [Acidobacteriota bacterium]
MKISNISKAVKVVMALMVCCLLFGYGGQEIQEKNVASIIDGFSAKIISGKGISYNFVHRGEGTLAGQFPETSGQVKVESKSGKNIGQIIRVRILAEMKKEEELKKINVAVADGISYSLDEQKKVLWRAPSYRSGVQMFNFQYIFPVTGLPDIQKAPADGAMIVRRDKVANISCVVVEHKAETIDYTYFFGEKDDWLYRIEARKEVWGDGAIVVELGNLKTGLEFDDGDFLIDLPDGYAQQEYSGNYPPIGESAPEWTLTTYSGEDISLKDLRGKVVVMDFWATWCGPCVESIPKLQALYDKYKDRNVEILGITFLEKGDPVTFMKERGVTYPIMPGDSIAKTYRASLPMVYVIDPEGRVVDIFNGYFGEESDERLERTIQEVMEKSGL